ncbi:hypothetical protein L596_009771 [Steinernema carpocapsae]|uniref:Uncharacterized protein n=1 Tax=Steinernema carpocapsae TaxID=34508 RepID=A0A4U5PGM4_STECR|nr:hypothetical protein L596_009771 [Steinernema carpocapsae]
MISLLVKYGETLTHRFLMYLVYCFGVSIGVMIYGWVKDDNVFYEAAKIIIIIKVLFFLIANFAVLTAEFKKVYDRISKEYESRIKNTTNVTVEEEMVEMNVEEGNHVLGNDVASKSINLGFYCNAFRLACHSRSSA